MPQTRQPHWSAALTWLNGMGTIWDGGGTWHGTWHGWSKLFKWHMSCSRHAHVMSWGMSRAAWCGDFQPIGQSFNCSQLRSSWIHVPRKGSERAPLSRSLAELQGDLHDVSALHTFVVSTCSLFIRSLHHWIIFSLLFVCVFSLRTRGTPNRMLWTASWSETSVWSNIYI